MKAIKIGIKSDRDNLWMFRRNLEYEGFHLDGNRYLKTCRTKHSVQWAKDYCKKKHLIFFYNNEYGERSQDYRKTFFQNNKPDRFGKYRCAYCGKRFKRQDITVDHLYPVAVVSKDLALQNKLKRKGINSLNAKENLVAACWTCNKAKGTQMGSWIRKGKRGRHKLYWVLRKVGFSLIILAVLGFIAGLVLVVL